MTGIYHIICKSSGRRYVGSSKSITHRWYAHRSALRNGKHHSKFLQRVFDKHGEDNLYFLVYEICDEKDLIQKENESLVSLVSLGMELNGRKLAEIGGTRKGIKCSDEHRSKMSEAQKGKPRTQKKHVYTEDERKALSEWMKERHRQKLVNTGHNQHTKRMVQNSSILSEFSV